jgi:N-acetylneuraminic acid mutarotase
MKKKSTTSQSGFLCSRVLLAVVLCMGFACLLAAATSPATSGKFALVGREAPAFQRTLTFEERVSYQGAIEQVYWRHRIWPKENPDPKPSLDAVMSQAQLENKVAGYLRDSLTLEDYWQKPITSEQLQAEMDRMARDTKQPEVLHELFEALGNDPFVIAECLARPVLTERLLGNEYERVDRGAPGQRAEVGLKESSPVNAGNQMPDAVMVPNSGYSLPTIADVAGGCTDDAWAATAIAPFKRSDHTAVWTGTEMIVWGGAYTGATTYPNTGGRYNPSTDSWTATSTANAPSGRWGHAAVWTGTEMIIWGGGDVVIATTGAKYNPVTNSWIAISTSNAPAPGFYTGVWTGSEMIVWSGAAQGGGKYNPNTNSWTATSNVNAPVLRSDHSSVWTGSEMIVWGGSADCPVTFTCTTNTGGRYNPNTNSWTATSTANAPTGRTNHTAVWTGNEMIVWGGVVIDLFTYDVNTGGRYDPSTDSWTATSMTNPPSERNAHTAVWTGSEMIIWGGYGAGGGNGDYGSLNTGGKYNLENGWTATTTTTAPTARDGHTAVWTGSRMIVWGGNYNDGIGFPVTLNTGGRYCGQSGPSPTPTPTPSATPASRLGNISTRAFVQTGDNVVIGGFIVQGTEPKRVIIRAIGPELTQYGVPNALANPTLELHNRAGALIASNDNWRTTIIGGIITSDQVRDILRSGHTPGDGRESAIIADLPPGNYTAIVRGLNNSTGVALAEVYDLSSDTSSILGNISTRSFVQAGDDVMIGGFIVQGTAPKRVIVRALGPELTQYGLPNALANPTLELHDSTGRLIARNDDWQHTIIGRFIGNGQVRDIIASGLAPADGRESAMVVELPAGNYTAIVRGVNNTTGVGLVEVYDLN